MRFSEFIHENNERILKEWVTFARSLLPWTTTMSEKALRDHAQDLLSAVVRDMETPQTDSEQAEKSKGHSVEGELGTIGQLHAVERLRSGFNLDELVSEYRALRASVLRMWAEHQQDDDNEITRFNEAIDESLGVAAVSYAEELHRTREQFLAILGHDLRNPLGAIIMGAESLAVADNLDDRQARVASRIAHSGARMARMIADLLDLTRTRLGGGIPIVLKPTDLRVVCELVVAELQAVHPDCPLRLTAKGALQGMWDGDRLTQVVSNLVANAVQYGTHADGVDVDVDGLADAALVRVHNKGAPIPADDLKLIFEPMVRRTKDGADLNPTGLGLGLHIAREIVIAHGGTIDATSKKQGGTTFTVRLPTSRQAPTSSPDRPE